MNDPVWPADPARVQPITVDPTYATLSMDANFDTFVQKGCTTDQSGATELRLGTYDGGTTVARSFLGFPLGSWRKYQVMDADLSLYATHSYSCSARNWSINSSGAASSVTKGYSSSCADARPLGPAEEAVHRPATHAPGCPAGCARIRSHRGHSRDPAS